MTEPIAGQVLGSAHLAAHRNVYDLNAYWGFVGDGATDNSPAANALATAGLPIGGLLTVAPGRYRFYSEVAFLDTPSLKFQALSGKHYQGRGTAAAPVQDGGVIFEGWTPGMTLFRFEKTTVENATHQGPTFEGIGFQDGRAVASRRAITSVSLVSGTTYRYTTSSAHSFVATDTIIVNGINNAAAPFGNALNGHVTVSNVPDTTHFDVVVGSNPTVSGLTYASASVFYAPSMRLLHIKKQTRARGRDCHFALGLQGVYLDPGGSDASWSDWYGCTFALNDTGFYGLGDAAQSISINGGDFQYGNGQIGIDFAGSAAMFKARDFKMDTLYNDGTGCVGVRLQQAANYAIEGSFEHDGPATAIQVGTTGAAFGRIACNFQGNNTGTKGTRVGTGVVVTGTSAGTTDTNTDVGEMSLMGSTFNGFGTCVNLSNTRGAKIIGGSQALSDSGINVASTCQGTVVAFFTRRRKESGSDTTAANHIVDNGVGTKRLFCDNVNADGGIVPAAGSTTQTSGFVHISSGAGPPTGVPTTIYAGVVPIYFDTTNLKFSAYSGGAWKTLATAFT